MKSNTSETINLFKKGIRWGWYDFGNSAYYVVYVALLFPLYLREQVFSGSKIFESYWGLVQGLAVALSVLISWSLSRYTDRNKTCKYWDLAKYAFVIPAALSFIFPLLIAFNAGGPLFLLSFLIIHGIYLASLIYYDASLMDISSGTNRIEISGWAWGWGYIGGVICLIAMKGLESKVGHFSWLYFSIGSLFFLLFAFYAAIKIRTFIPADKPSFQVERESVSLKPVSSITTSNLAVLLACMVLIMDGIAVYIGFISLYWNSAGISNGTILNLMILLQLLSFPFSGLMSMLTRKSVNLFLIMCGAIWLIAGFISALYPTTMGALISIVLVSTVLGASQAVLRTIYSEITTPQRRLFGFSVFALVEEGAAFVGPILAGLAINVFGYKPVLFIAAICIFIGSFGLALVTKSIGVYHKVDSNE